jgi:hypothetical protein
MPSGKAKVQSPAGMVEIPVKDLPERGFDYYKFYPYTGSTAGEKLREQHLQAGHAVDDRPGGWALWMRLRPSND